MKTVTRPPNYPHAVRMRTTAHRQRVRPTRPGCPAWCTVDHTEAEWHEHEVLHLPGASTGGGTEHSDPLIVGVFQTDATTPAEVFMTGELEGVVPALAVRLAEALLTAARIAGGGR